MRVESKTTEGSIMGTMNPSHTEGITEQEFTEKVAKIFDVPVSDQPKRVYPLSIHKRGKDEV